MHVPTEAVQAAAEAWAASTPRTLAKFENMPEHQQQLLLYRMRISVEAAVAKIECPSN